VGKQTVESARLNLLPLNFIIIKWMGLSHYGINFEQQTVLCLKQGVRICIYVNSGIMVKNIVFQFEQWIFPINTEESFKVVFDKKNEKSTMPIRIQAKESN